MQEHDPEKWTPVYPGRRTFLSARAGGGTMLRLTIGLGALALSSHWVPALTFDAADVLSGDAHPVASPAASGISEKPDAPAQALGAPLAPIGGRALSADNPL